MQGIEFHEKEVAGKVEETFREEQVESQTHCLNDDLIDVHTDMQLLSLL